MLELKDDTTKIRLSVEIFNPKSCSHNIMNGDFKILKNDTIIGTSQILDNIYIEASQSKIIDIYISLETKEIVKNLSQKIEQIEIFLDGSIESKVLLFDFNSNVNLPFKINLLDILEQYLNNDSEMQKAIKISSHNIKNIDFDKTTITTKFIFFNPYDIEFVIQSYPCKLFINDDFLGEGDLYNHINVNNLYKQVDGKIIFELNNSDIFKTMRNKLFSFKINFDFELKGILYLQILDYNIDFPYNYRGEFTRYSFED